MRASIRILDMSAPFGFMQDKLAVSISGKGTVTYMGKPKITQKILGTGKIEELK